MVAIEHRVENDIHEVAKSLSADPETYAHNVVEYARFIIDQSDPRR
jgi:hypothetical protein